MNMDKLQVVGKLKSVQIMLLHDFIVANQGVQSTEEQLELFTDNLCEAVLPYLLDVDRESVKEELYSMVDISLHSKRLFDSLEDNCKYHVEVRGIQDRFYPDLIDSLDSVSV